MSLLIFLMIGSGVPAGASRPNHGLSSSPPMPASPKVGRLGNVAERFEPVTAIARTLSPRICPTTEGKLVKVIWIWPPMVSVSAPAAPLYGT